MAHLLLKELQISKVFLLSLLILFLATQTGFTQVEKSVSGILQDSTGQSIIAATIKLVSATETLYSSSNVDGKFNFNLIKSSQFALEINSLGFEPLTKTYQFKNNQSSLSIDPITMKFDSKVLQEVKIEGSPLIVVKEDTLEYRAKDYNLRENAVTEDLLKKLDGVEVDKDGNLYVAEINRILRFDNI